MSYTLVIGDYICALLVAKKKRLLSAVKMYYPRLLGTSGGEIFVDRNYFRLI
jgi:hypothetical protein